MLSVVKRNILKGKYPPSFLVLRGAESGGVENKKKEKGQKYIKGSDVLALFSHTPNPTHPFTHPPIHHILLLFLFPKIVNFCTEEN
jgi:hypothetical protein